MDDVRGRNGEIRPPAQLDAFERVRQRIGPAKDEEDPEGRASPLNDGLYSGLLRAKTEIENIFLIKKNLTINVGLFVTF